MVLRISCASLIIFRIQEGRWASLIGRGGVGVVVMVMVMIEVLVVVAVIDPYCPSLVTASQSVVCQAYLSSEGSHQVGTAEKSSS